MKHSLGTLILLCTLSLNIYAQVGKNIIIPVLTEKSTLSDLEKYSIEIQKIAKKTPEEGLNIFAKAFYSIPLYRVLKYRSLDIIMKNNHLFKELITRAPQNYNLHPSDAKRLWIKISQNLNDAEFIQYINYNYRSPIVLALPKISNILISDLTQDLQMKKAIYLATKYGYKANAQNQSILNKLLNHESKFYAFKLGRQSNTASDLVVKNLKWLTISTLESVFNNENIGIRDYLKTLLKRMFKHSQSKTSAFIKEYPELTIEYVLRQFEFDYQLTENEIIGIVPKSQSDKRRLKLLKRTAKHINSYIGKSEELADWFYAKIVSHVEFQGTRNKLLKEIYPALHSKFPENITFLKLVQNYAKTGTLISDSHKLDIVKIFASHGNLPTYDLYKRTAFMIELSEMPLNYIKYLLIKKNRDCNHLLKSL